MARIGSPVPLGVDFKGGTQVQITFASAPDINSVRQATDAAGIKDAKIVPYDAPEKHELLVSLPESSDAGVDAGRKQILDALGAHYGNRIVESSVQAVGPADAQGQVEPDAPGRDDRHVRSQGLPLFKAHNRAFAVLLLDAGDGEVDGPAAILVFHERTPVA